MPTARQLLGIGFSVRVLREQAEGLVSSYTGRQIAKAKSSFEAVAKKHSTYAKQDPEGNARIYRLFLEHHPEGLEKLLSVFDSRRMGRRLAWALCYYDEREDVTIARSLLHLRSALTVIERQWGWGSLFGLFDALLRTWDSSASRLLLQEFVKRKLQDYDGRRPRLRNLQQHREFFVGNNGPARLASYLLGEGRTLTSIWEMLSLPGHVRSYPYFEEVVVAYTQSAMRARQYEEHIRPILTYLSEHGGQVAYKRCLSKIILRLDEDEPKELRENVIRVAFQKVGDPAHAPEWQPWEGASATERAELSKARQALNNWIAQRFITAFFDKVAMDADRRQFWLRYAPHVTRFKVFGDSMARRHLRQDKRIRSFVRSRFQTISGGMNALLMQIKDRIIVEFGQTGGACYIHRKGEPECPSFDERYTHIDQLRVGTSFPRLMRYSGRHYRAVKDQGRLLHQHEWERRLHWWMETKLGIKA